MWSSTNNRLTYNNDGTVGELEVSFKNAYLYGDYRSQLEYGSLICIWHSNSLSQLQFMLSKIQNNFIRFLSFKPE